MNYDELRLILLDNRKEVDRVTERLQSLQTDLKTYNDDLGTMGVRAREMVENEKQIAKVSWLQKTLSPIQSQIPKIEAQIQQTKLDYLKEVNSCNEEAIYQELKEKQNLPEDLESSMKQVKDVIVQDLGERFYGAILNNLGETQKQVSGKELRKIIRKVQDLQPQVARLAKRESFEVFDGISDFVDNITKNNVGETNKSALIFFGGASVVLGAAFFVTLPVYMAFLLGKAINNVRKNTVFSQALILYKVLNDNLERIETLLRKEAAAQKDKLLNEIEEEYEQKHIDLDQLLESKKAELMLAEQNADITFEFDELSVLSRFDSPRVDLINKVSMVEREIEKSNEELVELKTKQRDILSRLDTAVQDLISEYINYETNRKEQLLRPNFLIDVKDNVPSFWPFLELSTLISYDDSQEATNFCKLIAVQLRAQLSPSSLFIQIWDIDKMGSDFVTMFEEEKTLVKIYSSLPTIEDSMLDLYDQLLKRNNTILTEFDDKGGIKGYNEMMIQLNSVPESYYFIFVLNPPAQVMGHQRFHQLLTVGAKVGIFVIMLTPEEVDTDEKLEAAKRAESFYTLKDGVIKKKARRFFLESLKSFEN